MDVSAKVASETMLQLRPRVDVQLWWLLAGALVYWLVLFLFAWQIVGSAWLFSLLGLGTVLILVGQFFHHRRRRS